MSEQKVNKKSVQGTMVKPEEFEEIVPKRAKKGVEEVEAVKKITISVAHTPEQVLSFDKEGYLISFEDDPDRFLDLSLETVKELSPRTKAAYTTSFLFSKKLAEERKNPSSGVKVTMTSGSARQRLEVRGGPKGMHRAWFRPDQLSAKLDREGYKVVNDPDTKTFGSSPGSSHRVGAYGETELVLCEVPREVYDARQQALADKAARKTRAVEESTQEAIARMGGTPPKSFGAGANTPKKKEVIRKKVR